ncbi:hypothetical protein [Mesorhizobium sp. 1M-11]|uniref:hypothetical protein n=1 Tax=Mesorhizobium sp. 1M-11 TaxID=1529006 RepID=UPI00128FA448|nr:hypothetical protein [Mesorhizobium sp. 1M-11]
MTAVEHENILRTRWATGHSSFHASGCAREAPPGVFLAAMSHNPRREPGLKPEEVARISASIVKEMPAPEDRRWRDLFELSCWISERAAMGKTVFLSPATAHVVARHLSTCHEKPTRDDIALMICKRGEINRCADPCYDCRGKANIVIRAYGCGAGGGSR